MKELWAVSGIATRTIRKAGQDELQIRGMLATVEATSEFEAIGKGYQILRKGYSTDDGWKQHAIGVKKCSDPVDDPEHIIPPED